ncbi:hypothetical protein JJQ59_35570 (plasmid) [Cupriavidus necator]|uniref:hypothetical protein n=1 Tax=Cupriavidus necator TaxID=106590 RepID=UPI0011BEDEF3|nr:hypothetical protein [Cupriavidus necator]QQX89813.1 hypothetical protein JJQ59_35570 [Cupriavidus necator]
MPSLAASSRADDSLAGEALPGEIVLSRSYHQNRAFVEVGGRLLEGEKQREAHTNRLVGFTTYGGGFLAYGGSGRIVGAFSVSHCRGSGWCGRLRVTPMIFPRSPFPVPRSPFPSMDQPHGGDFAAIWRGA